MSLAQTQDNGQVPENIHPPAMSTETTRPYTAMIPDITTGISDCKTSLSHCSR